MAGTVIYGDVDEVAVGARSDADRRRQDLDRQDQRLRRLRVRRPGGEHHVHGQDRRRPATRPRACEAKTSKDVYLGEIVLSEVVRTSSAMAGITSYGAYIPSVPARAGRRSPGPGAAAPAPGERAVANYDEDSLTMAVAAARDCLKGVDRASVGGLYFASTTAPYKEKQSAALIAAVLGLAPDAITMDFSGSLRSGTNALKAALDAVVSGSRGERPGLRRRHPPGLSVRARRDELRRRRRGSACQRGDTIAEVKHFDSQVLRDPGHLALGQRHVRPLGRRTLRHGRGLRRVMATSLSASARRSTG